MSDLRRPKPLAAELWTTPSTPDERWVSRGTQSDYTRASSCKTRRLADSNEVAQAYRYEVARRFRDDVATFPI